MAGGQFRIRDMEIVVALHEEGNMTQAAKRLGFTEPALSKQLKEIERRIQTLLFERGNGGVVATASGRAFVAHAIESIQSFRRAIHDAHESKHNEPSRLRIGVSMFHPPSVIQLLHSVELRLYRNLSVEIVSAYSLDLISRVQQHELDLALVTTPPPNSQITSVHVATNPFMIAVREKHPLAGSPSVRLNEIAPYPWIFFNRSVHYHLHDMIQQRVKEEYGPISIRHYISSEDQIAALLTDNQTVAWTTPTGRDKLSNCELKFVPLLDSQIHLEMRLVTLANNNSPLVSAYVRGFMKRVEEQRAPLQLQLPIVLKGDEAVQE
jgi:DNA-binding transcriptional LysR family regulator